MDTLNEDLLNAAKNSDFTAVDKCIKNGAIVNCRDKVGGTPLHWVSNRGQTNIADLLISKGASTNIKSLKGKTPLHLAAKRGYKDTAVLLISNGADINSRDKFGGTPLHWAASRGQRDTAHLLISRGANVNIKRINDVTPLHLAASKDHTDTADLLISKGADIDTKSISGYTALDMAEGKTKMVLQSINESQVTGAAKYCDILGESPSNVHSLLQARSPVSHDILPADRVQRPEQDNEMSGIKDATTFKSLLYGGTYESYGNCIYLAGACNVGKSTLASLLIGDKIPLKWKSTNGLRIYFGRNGIDVKNRKMVPLKKGKGNFVLSNVLRGHPDIKQDVTEKGVDFSDLTLNDGDVKHPSEFEVELQTLNQNRSDLPPPETNELQPLNQNGSDLQPTETNVREHGSADNQHKYSAYSDEDLRTKSFTTWDHVVSPAKLAAAGFFYSGYGFKAKCFSCGKLVDWKDPGDPMDEQLHDDCKHLHDRRNISNGISHETSPKSDILDRRKRQISQLQDCEMKA